MRKMSSSSDTVAFIDRLRMSLKDQREFVHRMNMVQIEAAGRFEAMQIETDERCALYEEFSPENIRAFGRAKRKRQRRILLARILHWPGLVKPEPPEVNVFAGSRDPREALRKKIFRQLMDETRRYNDEVAGGD